MNPIVPDELGEIFSPHGPERSPHISSTRVASQVFVFLGFYQLTNLLSDMGFDFFIIGTCG